MSDYLSGRTTGGTYLGEAISRIAKEECGFDRIIVFTDEQAADRILADHAVTNGYIVNVASNRHGVDYGKNWTQVSGWSESVIQYITQLEKAE